MQPPQAELIEALREKYKEKAISLTMISNLRHLHHSIHHSSRHLSVIAVHLLGAQVLKQQEAFQFEAIDAAELPQEQGRGRSGYDPRMTELLSWFWGYQLKEYFATHPLGPPLPPLMHVICNLKPSGS